ncbi:ATP-binding protein [uncultured Alteromonas sp.]|jgi:adenylate kinase family enzyme|uniref:AAA family ATPase n=1 Tax=uncultured Alteromonas sp. TaxID=179113 RepID=UPI0025FA809C|nr:ATP-binding protein [uncultured Alteromonas sp.]
MSSPGKLFFFCGKMGAGKSTRSRLIAKANNAVVISEDDWLTAHYPELIQTFDDYIKYSALIRPFVKSHVQGLLNIGGNVVMDFPANTVKQRAWFTSLCTETHSEHELWFLDVSDEHCLAQIAQRRVEQPQRAKFDTEAVFHQVTRYFEAPAASENLNIVRVT